MMKLADIIQRARLHWGLSTRALAETVGISHTYLSQIERGIIQKPSLAVLKKLASALPQVSYWDLLSVCGYIETPNSPPASDSYQTDTSNGLPLPPSRNQLPYPEPLVVRAQRAVKELAHLTGVLPLEPITSENYREIPLFTSIPAGFSPTSPAPIYAFDECETVKVPVSYLSGDPTLFALRVVGDSMKDAGILPGDVVIVAPSLPYNSGDICVVRVNGGEHSIKRIIVQGNYIILQPANNAYEPTVIDNSKENDLFIYGKVIRVERNLV